jgi:hypothetical protein
MIYRKKCKWRGKRNEKYEMMINGYLQVKPAKEGWGKGKAKS